jgi:hypothetical protein
MLPQFSKFVVVNNSGSTITWTSGNDGRIKLSVDGWIIDPETGKITYTNILAKAESADFNGAAEAVVNGGEIVFAEIDNTTTKFLGFQIQLEVTHDLGTAADGRFDVFISASRLTNDGPVDQTGYASAEANNLDNVGGLTWEPNASDDDVQTSNVMEW